MHEKLSGDKLPGTDEIAGARGDVKAAYDAETERGDAPPLSLWQRLSDRLLSLFFRDEHPGLSPDERERRTWDRQH